MKTAETAGNWSEPKVVDRLREMQAAGKSASETSAILYREFGMYFSRNAIVGKWHRLKLVYERPSKPAKIKAAPKPRPIYAGNPKDSPQTKRINTAIANAKAALEADTRPLRTVTTDAKPRLLLDLTPSCCRFPVSDPPAGQGETMLFCAAPREAGQAYCEAHCKIATTKPTVWQKNAARPDGRIAA